MRSIHTLLLLPGLIALLAACAVPVRTVPAPAVAPPSVRSLVIVLPGGLRGGGVELLNDAGFAEAVHAVAPQSDVLLTGATVAYHIGGRLPQRLHEQVILPAREQGYTAIWLVAASLAALDALVYEHEHPGELAGLVLLAPLLDDATLLQEITAAGGLAYWQPGPTPPRLTGDNYQREIWRMAQGWRSQTALARRVWIACGSEDRLLPAARLLASVLPPGHSLEPPGGHKWEVWSAATQEILVRSRGLSVAAR